MKKIDPQKTINKFVKEFIKFHQEENIQVTGIILFGSFLDPKKMNRNSDLDIYLVIKNNGMRYRGVRLVDNIEIDYFANPIEQIEKELSGTSSGRKTLISLLAEGKIMLDETGALANLKKRANKYRQEETESDIPDSQIIFMKYFIEDYLKDIEDGYEIKNKFSLQYNMALLSNYLIEVFCKYNHIPIMKPKHQKEQIIKKDPGFVEIYGELSRASNEEKRIIAIKKLSNYTLEKLGGKLPKEWEIKSTISQ